MTTRLVTPSRPAPGAPGPARQRRIRSAVAVAAVAVAAGGYIATTTVGPDATPRPAGKATDVNPSTQVLRELRDGIAGQYGSRSAPNATVNPSAQVQRELRDSVAGQYGPAR